MVLSYKGNNLKQVKKYVYLDATMKRIKMEEKHVNRKLQTRFSGGSGYDLTVAGLKKQGIKAVAQWFG